MTLKSLEAPSTAGFAFIGLYIQMFNLHLYIMKRQTNSEGFPDTMIRTTFNGVEATAVINEQIKSVWSSCDRNRFVKIKRWNPSACVIISENCKESLVWYTNKNMLRMEAYVHRLR